MIHLNTVILQFEEHGDKTGWSYIIIPAAAAQQLKPGNKKAFRVIGKLDDFAIKGVALLPIGAGDFMMPVNATMRKGIKKRKGASVKVQLEVDHVEMKPPAELMECLQDEPKAIAHFNTLAKSHQNYFGKWINDAKTEQTKTKRIASAVDALAKGFDFGRMIRTLKQEKDELLR